MMALAGVELAVQAYCGNTPTIEQHLLNRFLLSFYYAGKNGHCCYLNHLRKTQLV